MATTVFDYRMWSLRYPELSGSVSSGLAAAYFNEACLYLDATDGSLVTDPNQRALILNMLVSHIAQLNAAINGQTPSSLVGRISSASEGSVSVSTDVGGIPGTASWFAQTRYGLSAWAAMAGYRTFRYIAPTCFPNSAYGYPWGRC